MECYRNEIITVYPSDTSKLLHVSTVLLLLRSNDTDVHSLFTNSPIVGHFNCFQFLAGRNKAAMSNFVQVVYREMCQWVRERAGSSTLILNAL